MVNRSEPLLEALWLVVLHNKVPMDRDTHITKLTYGKRESKV